MKPRAALHQSAPSAIARAMSKALTILPAAADADALAHADADQGVVHEDQALAHRHAEMIDEFERRRAGAALLAVDDDEIGIDPVSSIALQIAQELPGMADAELEADRLAAREARAAWR